MESRRDLLSLRPNPAPHWDHLSILRDLPVALHNKVSLQYIPDRHLLDPVSFRHYLAVLSSIPWPGPEELCLAIADDVSNQVMPRWLQVTVTFSSSDGQQNQAVAQDTQPGWSGKPIIPL
ncbi:hypothetical protein IHV25_04280 [Phaeovibrio sulfidiphilus]|uniref:Uncharacterized protein n=1 Tax=Phaeovibrio sulfidiphilus TaxID=1220600 RepID=A0A8J6YMZ7_9PROT|nr:hypothetical protein [Phaeovibrio sulfidiphilus]MBE1236864.1 hypothetical protein [Phaeovibrio sulfidiphilus]